ncbi:AAA family ATPase, partial [Candidatus Darwinibacter acetoxidans]
MADVRAVAEFGTKMMDNIAAVIVGKEQTAKMLLVALLSRGHVLLEDVPGVGKTMLARSIAASIGGSFSRIQCTPDLLPSDITGLSIYDQKQGDFTFRPGPIMAQIVLADEINRATPRTQSSLLEAMGEGQVTVDGTTYDLGQPFLVLATQNPVEFAG